MGKKYSSWSGLVFSLYFGILGLGFPPYGQAETSQNLWNTVDISWERTVPSNEDCELSLDQFLACTAAIRNVLYVGGVNFNFLPTSVIGTPYFENASLHSDYGPLAFVTFRAPTEKLSPIESRKRSQAQELAVRRAWEKIFTEEQDKKIHADFSRIFSWIKQNIVNSQNEKMVSGLLRGSMLQASDAHASFLPAAYWKQRGQAIQTYAGLGITTQRVGKNIVVGTVLKNSGADVAELRPGDIILSVQGQSTENMDEAKLSELSLGDAGTTLSVKIKRAQVVTELMVERRVIQIANVQYEFIETNHVGRISLRSFLPEDSCTHIQQALVRLTNRGATSIILDLRNNHGGLVPQASCIASLFLNPGYTVVREVHIANLAEGRDYQTSDQGFNTQLPLVILQNAASASASELLAGALQDYQRAVVVGLRSYGKGSVQYLDDSPNFAGAMEAHTRSRFYRPSGSTNQMVGILPDIEAYASPFPKDEEMIFDREDNLFPNALPAQGKAWVSPRADYNQQLTACVHQNTDAVTHYNDAQRGEDRVVDYAFEVAIATTRCMEKITPPPGVFP